MKKFIFITMLCIGLMSCNDEPKTESNHPKIGNEIDISDPRIQNAQIVCCGVQSPQQNLPWLNDMIKKANTDDTGNYFGTIWLEKYKDKDIFVTNMMLGSGGLMYHFFDCSGNNFAYAKDSPLQTETEEFYSFSLNMKLNVVIYSNLNKIFYNE